MENANNLEQPTENTVEQAPEKITLDQVEKKYYGPEQLGSPEAQNYMERLGTHLSGNHLLYGFDPEQFPSNAGLLILPVATRRKVEVSKDANGKPIEEVKNVPVGVVLAALPTPESVLDDPKGREYVRDLIINNFAAKIAQVVRPRDKGDVDPKAVAGIPRSLTDFLEAQKRDEGWKNFSTLAKKFVPMLVQRGFTGLSQAVFRKCVESAAHAEATYPSVDQKVWESIIQKLRAAAQKEGWDITLYDTLLATRNERGIAEVKVDVADLDDLELSMEEEETAPAE